MQQEWKVQRNLAVVAGITALAFALLILFMQLSERSRIESVLRQTKLEKARVLGEFIGMSGAMQEALTNDYSRWDDLVSFVSTADRHWAQINLQPVLESFHVSAIWVLERSGNILYTSGSPESLTWISDSLVEHRIRSAIERGPFAHYFMRASSGAIEVRIAPIQPTTDTLRSSDPTGYFVVVRRLDSMYLEALSQAIGGDIVVRHQDVGRSGDAPSLIRRSQPLDFEFGLPGPEGGRESIAIVCTLRSPFYAEMVKAITKSAIILSLSGGLIFVIVTWCLYKWVSLPLRRISDCLELNDVCSLADLSLKKTEFGAIARLLILQHRQRDLLISQQLKIEASEVRFRRLLESVREGIAIVDTDEIVTYCNPALAEQLGLDGPHNIVGRSILEFIAPHTHEQMAMESAKRRRGESSQYEMDIVTNRGERRVLLCSVRPWYGSDGKFSGAVASMTDISVRRMAEERLLESHHLLEAILNSIPIRVFWKDRNLVYLGCNSSFARDAGFDTPEGVVGKDDYSMSWRSEAQYYQADDRAVIESGEAKVLYEELQTTPSGEQICLLTSKVPLRDAGGTTVGVLGTYYDITERRRAEDELRDSEARTRAITDSAQDAIVMMGPNKLICFWNPAATRIFGYTIGDAFGQDFYSWISPERSLDSGLSVFRDGDNLDVDVETIEVSVRHKDGHDIPCQLSLSSVSLKGVKHVVGIVHDLSVRKSMERQKLLLSAAIESAAEVIVVTDKEGRIEYANSAFETVTGYARGDVLGKRASINKSGKHNIAFYCNLWETILSGQTWKGQFKNQRKDGSLYDEEATISPVRDQDGITTHFVAVKRNITEELLLKQQLLQAQKAEALGVLAGGIAHDFNNMLTAIIGFATLLQSKGLDHERVVSHASEIAKTGARAATLTRQLLSYSRKQIAVPSSLDLNLLIESTKGMLSRVMGENHVLTTHLDPLLGRIFADPGQVEQVILNLVVNARDAMPAGGTILLTTCRRILENSDLKSLEGMQCGPHIEMACTDSGCGMAPDILDHIFEPFFTTKEIGKGTGLGLSTVYGIIKEGGGHIKVASELGNGSCFTILLPEVESNHIEQTENGRSQVIRVET